ncbi:O-antigen ligase family protein [Allomeiothermus silvanus]|uniref:O-antigen ligase family protein n=1 Tax=Allomeiothermus silvanus TaxID=52022 RepID=UPI0023F3BDCF|nr:O-antigen ligase family protein [Allomeiothermus silvanus]
MNTASVPEPFGKALSQGMMSFLAVLTLALSPVDVVDLAGGLFPFSLTPFLLLSFLLVAIGLFGLPFLRTSRYAVRRALLDYWPLLGIALVILVSVVFVNEDPEKLSLKRALLTLWLVFFAVYLLRRLGLTFPDVFTTAAKVYLLLDALCILLQIFIFYHRLVLPSSLMPFFDLRPGAVAGLPRLGGLVLDPNRAAIDLVLILGLLYLMHRSRERRLHPGWLLLGVLLIIPTISRTGYVAALLLLGSLWTVYARVKTWHVLIFLLGLAALVLLLPASLGEASLFDKLQSALSTSKEREQSTSIHFALLATGYELLFSEVKNFLVGVGWGTSYVYTEPFFPGNKYGNFHSGYITVAATTGIFGFLFYLSYLLWPLLRRLPWWPLVIPLLWANLFYEYTAEPLYWTILAVLNASFLQRGFHWRGYA